LEPGAVVEGGVPEIDRRVVAAERDFQVVVLVEAYDAAFYFYVKTGGGR